MMLSNRALWECAPSCPYVDEFRPFHNIESLAELCQVLSESVRPRRLKQQQYQEAV